MNSQLHETLNHPISSFEEIRLFNSSANSIKLKLQQKYNREGLIGPFKNMKTIPNVIQNKTVFERQKTYHVYHRNKKPDIGDNQLQSLKAVCRPIKKTDTANDIKNMAQAHENADIYFKRFKEDKYLFYSHDLWGKRFLMNALEKSGLKQVGLSIREQYRNNTTKLARLKFSKYLRDKLKQDLKEYGSDIPNLISQLIEINTDRKFDDEENTIERIRRYRSETNLQQENNQLEFIYQQNQTKQSQSSSHLRTSESKKRQQNYYLKKGMLPKSQYEMKSWDGPIMSDISSQLRFELSEDIQFENQNGKEIMIEGNQCTDEKIKFVKKIQNFGYLFKCASEENKEIIKLVKIFFHFNRDFQVKAKEIEKANKAKIDQKRNIQNTDKIRAILFRRKNYLDQIINHRKRKVQKRNKIDDFD